MNNTNQSPLHIAARDGDLETLRQVVAESPMLVNQDDQHGWRPIFHASLKKQYEAVKILLDHGADVSAHSGYVMHYAAEVPENMPVIRLLVQYGALDAHTEPGNQKARQLIHSVFLDNAPRIEAMLSETRTLAKERYAREDTALHHACRNGATEVVEVLLKYGADIHAYNESHHFPLYCAAGHGHAETVKALLAHRTDTSMTLDDGKTTAEWLEQYVQHDVRLQECLTLITGN